MKKVIMPLSHYYNMFFIYLYIYINIYIRRLN